MTWTDERIVDLKRFWLAGLSASQVARKLGGGVTRNAVIGRVHRMGLAGRDAPARPRSVGGRPPSAMRARARASAGGMTRAALGHISKPLAAHAMTLDIKPSATILTLGEHTCRWPIGEPGDAAFGYCGRAKTGQRPYCADHVSLAFRRPAAPKAATAQAEYLARRYAG